MKPHPELKKRILEDMLGKSYEAYVNFKKEPFLPKKRQHRQRIPLWRFILHLLHLDEHRIFIEWNQISEMEFRIKDPVGVASLWGSIKDKADMTYEKLGRAMRYYYGKNIIEKVAGKRYSYRFILSRKTKRYIDEFSRKKSVSSTASTNVDSDENSSVSEEQSDFEFKEDECTSPDSGCAESTNDSEEYHPTTPNLDVDSTIPSDFWDIPWQDLVSTDRNFSSLYIAPNLVQSVNNYLPFNDIKQEPIQNNEVTPTAVAVPPVEIPNQGFLTDLLFDIKPITDVLFQTENTQNLQYFFE